VIAATGASRHGFIRVDPCSSVFIRVPKVYAD